MYIVVLNKKTNNLSNDYLNVKNHFLMDYLSLAIFNLFNFLKGEFFKVVKPVIEDFLEDDITLLTLYVDYTDV
jgi:hypothetical protein